MRKLFRAILAFVLSVAVADSAYATGPGAGGGPPDNSPGGLFDSEQTIDRIPLLFSDEYRAAVLYLVVVTSFNIYALQALNADAGIHENFVGSVSITLNPNRQRAPPGSRSA